MPVDQPANAQFAPTLPQLRHNSLTETDSSLLPPKNLVDRAVRERDNEQVAVRAGLDVGGDAEVPPEQQALALHHRPLVRGRSRYRSHG